MKPTKTLVLLRHAKAESGTALQEDSTRALALKGIAGAGLIGAYLKRQQINPELVLCSSAVRTRQTLAEVQRSFSPPLDVQYHDRLYHASVADMLTAIEAVPEDVHTLMLVGHNPGLHQLCLKLARLGDERKIDMLAMKFPTASCVSLRYENTSWAELGKAKGMMVDFVTPATLGGEDD